MDRGGRTAFFSGDTGRRLLGTAPAARGVRRRIWPLFSKSICFHAGGSVGADADCGQLPLGPVSVFAVLWRAGLGPLAAAGGPVSSGISLGRHSWDFPDPDGNKGNTHLRGGADPSDFLLSAGFWLGVPVDVPGRQQPETVSAFVLRGTSFAFFGDFLRELLKSVDFTAISAKNIVKRLKFGPFFDILKPTILVEGVRWTRRYDGLQNIYRE